MTPPNSPLNNLKIDVHVTSTPELQVQTSLAKLTGDVDLRLRGTAARVRRCSGASTLPKARFQAQRDQVQLERGDIHSLIP